MAPHEMGRAASVLIVLASLLPCSRSAGAADPVILDQTVAVVAGKFQGGVPPQVITRWDLESECRLESLQRYGSAGVDRPISKSLRATILDRIIDESLIYREAVRLDGAKIEDEEVDEALEHLAGTLGGREELARLLEESLIPEDKVRVVLARRIIADRYVLDSLRLTLSLTESELESAFSTMDHPFKDRELDEVREEFRDFMLGVMARKHRDDLVEDLKTRCRIWVFLNPGSVEAE